MEWTRFAKAEYLSIVRKFSLDNYDAITLWEMSEEMYESDRDADTTVERIHVIAAYQQMRVDSGLKGEFIGITTTQSDRLGYTVIQ